MTQHTPARSPGLCAAESLAVLRHHCQQPALRQRGRHRRAADARRRRRPGRRFYPFAAGRLKSLCSTGRHQLFRRPEAASFHCPRSGQKAELYIFDDSFSALDFKTDAALRKALAKETQDAAVLIIAQRVSTIQHADQIVVLNEGQMVGLGKHEELLQNLSGIPRNL